jgi:hypothetical protein
LIHFGYPIRRHLPGLPGYAGAPHLMRLQPLLQRGQALGFRLQPLAAFFLDEGLDLFASA